VGEREEPLELRVGGGEEMQDLAAAFNALLGALEERRGANAAFVADLVHEFKNPVATIRACADSLAESTIDADRAARLSRLLRDSSARLDTLVTQFLELARADAGMLHEPREVVDMSALAKGVVQVIALAERYAGVRFEVDAPGPARVIGIAYRLDSVVRNLVENAASFSGDGGLVRVELRAVGEKVTLSVSDTGPGIEQEDLPKVFTRFFTTRGREQGSGLGLALTRAIIEAHGGAIGVQSSRSEGATFVVDLPRAEPGEAERA
jgi:two-component system sensor histidine kinase ChvG